MLDKSVPYVGFLMVRKAGTPVPVYDLPAGYKFVLYKPGDEKSWAAIETSVLEFESGQDALNYFDKEFLTYASELDTRCMFIENEQGEKVATSTAWWCCPEKCIPRLHWVAVKPDYQGLGLGKAIISRVTQLMLELEGDKDFFLHTQTWSHKAVKIYEKLGYNISSEKKICNDTNEAYEKAVKVLQSIK